MTKLFLSVALLIIGTGVYAQTAKPATATSKTHTTATTTVHVLKTKEDSLSYSIGVNLATYFKSQGITSLSYAQLDRAIADVFAGKVLSLDDQQSVSCIQETIQKKLHDSLSIKAKPFKDEGAKFLAENKKRPGVFETSDGLQYEIIRRGTGAIPTDTSVVKVNYTGYLLNGKKFDASADHGGPATFPLNRVIHGWTEGLKQMPVGSSFKFYIPSNLAYGDQGSGAIPPGSTLIFDVDLLDIVQPGAAAATPNQ